MRTNAINLTTDHPYFYLVGDTESNFCDLQLSLNQNQNITTRMIRGKKCTKVENLFDEFSAALQFPYISEGTGMHLANV
jgi:galactose mutarotase-like enzyme